MFKWIRNLLGGHDWPKGCLVPQAVGIEAEKLAARGNFTGAVAVYDRFIREHPDSAHGLNNAAGFLLELKNGAKAKHYCEKALEIDPDYEAALCNLAEAKLQMKDLVGARDTFERTLRTHSRSVAARMGLGRMFLELKNGKMAYEHFTEAVRLSPRNPVVWHSLGKAKMLIGDLDGAEEEFRRVTTIDPKSEHGRQGLAHVTSIRQMAMTLPPGATLRTGDGTIISATNRTLACHTCGKKYTEHGQIIPGLVGQRSFGGALCRSCGKFYCEPCVARAIHSSTKLTRCACGKACMTLGDDGCVKLEGFEELVVFPVS